MKSRYDIAVLPGDGIGLEVTAAALVVLEAVQSRYGLTLDCHGLPGGAMHYRDSGDAFPEASMQACRQADAVLFGAMGWPDIRYPNGTDIAPQLDLRFELELFAGVRPIRAIPGVPLPLVAPAARDIDFVILRESTEGWFHARGRGVLTTGLQGDEAVHDICEISRGATERLFDFAFDLARSRGSRKVEGGRRAGKGLVTCVDKSGVYLGMAFMNQIFRERAALNPDITAEHANIDAFCLNLVRNPWAYDVCPMENQFGDITSDLGAGLIGGLGYAPSADIGLNHAVFQPSHGTAPDIAGRGIANPTAMILSAAMMLDWLGSRHDAESLTAAARAIEVAVDKVFEKGLIRPFDIGGNDGTQAVANAVVAAL